MKLVTKTIANRLKHVLLYIVGEFQSAFVLGRLITNNALIAFEGFNYMRKKQKGKIGYVGMKLDMAKAYDQVKWLFSLKVLRAMGFPEHWVELISKCVSTVSFSNGFPRDAFKLEKGLHQGDPLSLYLFILCIEVLSSLVLNAQERKALHGRRTARSTLEISHLFFAGDSFFFLRANKQKVDMS